MPKPVFCAQPGIGHRPAGGRQAARLFDLTGRVVLLADQPVLFGRVPSVTPADTTGTYSAKVGTDVRFLGVNFYFPQYVSNSPRCTSC